MEGTLDAKCAPVSFASAILSECTCNQLCRLFHCCCKMALLASDT